MLSSNVKPQPLLMLRREADLVHPQLNKLLKSILYDYRRDFFNLKKTTTSKHGNERDI